MPFEFIKILWHGIWVIHGNNSIYIGIWYFTCSWVKPLCLEFSACQSPEKHHGLEGMSEVAAVKIVLHRTSLDNRHQTLLFYLCCEAVLRTVISEDDTWLSLLFFRGAREGVLDFPCSSRKLSAVNETLLTVPLPSFHQKNNVRRKVWKDMKIALEVQEGKARHWDSLIWFVLFLR